MRLPAFALLVLLPLAAPAADEPEAVYAKFHRAAVSGDVEEMQRYVTRAQREEMAVTSAAQRAATAKMMAALLPRAYLVQNKAMVKTGQGARLLVSGPGPQFVDGKPETLYGSIQMLMEGGEWKVGEMDWTNTRPDGPTQAKPAAAAAAPKGQAAPAARGATALGTPSGAPVRTLGTAKPPCVYKPVMTAEDLENCR